MDDRFLLVSAPFMPHPDSWSKWPGSIALLNGLRARLPVDIFPWPTRRGADGPKGGGSVTGALFEAIKPHHHVIDMGGGAGLAILMVAKNLPQPPRSVTLAGFFPTPATARAMGKNALADSMDALFGVVASGPSTALIQLQAEGASEDFIQTARRQIERELDRGHLQAYMSRARTTDFSRERFDMSFPVLYLRMLSFPGADSEEADEIFKQLVPKAEIDSLEKWGSQLQLEDGGSELAGKVAGFVERVIAARGTRATVGG
ncbi:MAG TPA: hypothetical protein VFO84_07645 [Dehalococcoidia bacterium]|nr:hypothetical protein [Dehalococcoidia bacterium]